MARFDEDKALAVILYLIKKAGGELDLYKLVKMAYFADKTHLHTWGRTITGDCYGRLPHGATPSSFYNMIRSIRGASEWHRDLSVFFQMKRENVVGSTVLPDLDELSDSDIEILDQVFEENINLSFNELKRKAHNRAYNQSTYPIMDDYDLAEEDPEVMRMIDYHDDIIRYARQW